jgi:hypothetical protein
LYARVFFGQICNSRRNDDLVQGKLLPGKTIHAKQAGEEGGGGVNLWYLMDSTIKFVYNFEIYCRKDPNVLNGQAFARNGEGNMAGNVVLGLMVGLEGKGHVVVCANYFSSIGLFKELYSRDIYGTSTMRSIHVGLLLELSNLRKWNGVEQGTLEWRMHNSNKIACVMWKDKRPVLLISTHAVPIQAPCIHPRLFTTVLLRNGPIRDTVHTSPIDLEYTSRMRGVDVADQLQASYSCQIRSHKWWHRVFFLSP